MHARNFVLPAVVLALVLGACSSPDGDPLPPAEDVAAPTDGAPPQDVPDGQQPSQDAPMEPLPAMAADWSNPFAFDLPNGWTLTHCEGDAPMLCLLDGERHVGFLELGEYPLPAEAGDDARAYLDRHVQDFLDAMREDRAVGCPALSFEPTPPLEVEVGGQPGVRAGFRLVDDRGAEVERHVLYWTAVDDTVFSITAPAYAEGGCMEAMGEFAPADLGLVTLFIDRIVADTTLPAVAAQPQPAEALADGDYVGRIVRRDAPVSVVTIDLVQVLSGREAVDMAQADGQIGPGEDLPNDVYVRDPEPDTWDLRVAAATVAVYDCTRACQHLEIQTPAFLTGERLAMNREHAIFELTISDGAVTELAEIYLP